MLNDYYTNQWTNIKLKIHSLNAEFSKHLFSLIKVVLLITFSFKDYVSILKRNNLNKETIFFVQLQITYSWISYKNFLLKLLGILCILSFLINVFKCITKKIYHILELLEN